MKNPIPTLWIVHRLAPTYIHAEFSSSEKCECINYANEVQSWYDKVIISDPIPLYEIENGWILRQVESPIIKNRFKRAFLALIGKL